MGEITISTKGNQFALLVSQRLFNELELNPDANYELLKAKKGVWVLIEKAREGKEAKPIDKRIYSLLKQKSLKEKVEGKFERFLNREEQKRFREMLQEGSIVAFKLSEKYKKAIYKTREEIEKEQQAGKGQKEEQKAGEEIKEEQRGSKGQGKEKPIEQYTLEKEGFLVCKNEQRVRKICQELQKEIKEGQIKGIKSFDGFFYVIESKLYNKHRNKVLSTIGGNKSITMQELAAKTGLSTLLAKIVCEFLKDEGEIIEKRKDLLQAV